MDASVSVHVYTNYRIIKNRTFTGEHAPGHMQTIKWTIDLNGEVTLFHEEFAPLWDTDFYKNNFWETHFKPPYK